MTLTVLLLAALSSLASLFSAVSPQDFQPTFFAQIETNNATPIRGDSTVISIVLYSDGEFVDAECKTTKVLKHPEFRCISGAAHRMAGQAIVKGKRDNRVVWSQYVVKSEKVKDIKIKPLKFTAQIRYYEYTPSPFSGMWGQRRRYKDFTAKCSTPTFEIKFTEKPKKSTRELLKYGKAAI